MKTHTLFEQFQTAVAEDIALASDIIVEHDQFWSTFEDDAPSWEECYLLIDNLFQRKREELAFTVVQHMFGHDDRLDDVDIDLNLSEKISAADCEPESLYVSMVTEVLKSGEVYLVRASGSVTTNRRQTFDGDLELQLSETGMRLTGFEQDPEDLYVEAITK